MARSNQGGTRGFLRGRVANDLYQVTKTANGRKLQLVRSVEESRVNNNTIMQAVARMQMALCMGCLKQFKEIVDHSWENTPYGQLSIARFVQLNIPLIQSDNRLNWEGLGSFNMPRKGVSRVRFGEFIMAEGSLSMPDSVTMVPKSGAFGVLDLCVQLDVPQPTMGDVKRCLGAAADDYITALVIQSRPKPDTQSMFWYRRIYISDIPDDTLLTPGNVLTFFKTEGTAYGYVQYLSDKRQIRFELNNDWWADAYPFTASCVVCSVWDGRKWCRNNARMTLNSQVEVSDFVESPNEVFDTWFDGYDPNNPYNPYDL